MADLVIDVGMHNAEDTAYYLASGYDVVAIDANPEKCDAAGQRFEAEILSGRLEVLNVGIGDPNQPSLKFWASSESAWSSFDRANATRRGAIATPIDIDVVSFADLLENYETPLYVKLDIEGNDSLCLRQMCSGTKLPKFVSFEAYEQAADDIEALSKVGYRGFRCIRQNDWREITLRNMRRQAWARKVITRLGRGSRVHYRPRRVKGHELTKLGSGPLPWTFSGPWRSAGHTQRVWEFLNALDEELNATEADSYEWFDIHALLDP